MDSVRSSSLNPTNKSALNVLIPSNKDLKTVVDTEASPFVQEVLKPENQSSPTRAEIEEEYMITIMRQRQIRKDENQNSIKKKNKLLAEEAKLMAARDESRLAIPSGVFTTDHNGKKLNIT